MVRAATQNLIAIGCLGAGFLTACSQGDPLDHLAQGETGRVVRIIDGDALVLDTGLTVRLVGIEAPAPQWRAREGQPHAEKSARMLEDMVMGRQVRLIYPGITRDRYDRALAYVKTEDRLGPDFWLNREMLQRGGARARFYPDTIALGDLLADAEAEARASGRGLWALADYHILEAGELPEAARGFYIVAGKLAQAEPPGEDDDAHCIRALEAARLTLRLEQAASELCNSQLTGYRLQVRGYVYEGQMEITHGLNVAEIASSGNRLTSAKAP